jgi:hypothetical protein
MKTFKVEEGKHKMIIINAIRNNSVAVHSGSVFLLLLRAFAVIRNDKPFVENVCISG